MTPFFAKDKDDWFLPEDQRGQLKKFLQQLTGNVILEVFTRSGENDPYTDFTNRFLNDLTRLNDNIKVSTHHDDPATAEKFEVSRFPTILVNPDTYRIRFTGAPAGEEGQAFLLTILLVSAGESRISPGGRQILAGLTEKRTVRVFTNPGCPYCPGQAVNGIRAAIERPDLVSMECVETGENQDYADQYNVGSVPHTVYNDELNTLGLEPEEVFMTQLVSLEQARETAEPQEPGVEQTDVVIIGGGPAGLTAGIYARRAGLKAVVLEKSVVGGQVAVTPVVENYPGFASIGGRKLVEMVREQAEQYVPVHEGEGVGEIRLGRQVEVLTNRTLYQAKAIIFAAGATWKQLGVPGEERFHGRGVSYCASCDGYLYKGREVIVVGGGNTALTDALHLKNLGVEVTIVHRRDTFRAEQHLVDSVLREEIPVLYNTVVTEISGEKEVESVALMDVNDGTIREQPVQGVFLAIGVKPNAELLTQLGVKTGAGGYVEVDAKFRTSLPRIYAAGDVTGGVQQIVTAVSEGAAVAMTVFEDLMKKG
jgi:thioredoxin reductase (NADPH)